MDVVSMNDNSASPWSWRSWAFWNDQGLDLAQLSHLLEWKASTMTAASAINVVVTGTPGPQGPSGPPGPQGPPGLGSGLLGQNGNYTPCGISPVLTKSGKPDILGDFFGKDINALLIINEQGAMTIPFMDKFGIVWLQESFDKWFAYDRDEFLKFIRDDNAEYFYGPRLTKEQVMNKLADPNNG